MNIKELIIKDLDKLSLHEQGLVYKFIRTKLIANIPGVSIRSSEDSSSQIESEN